MNSKIITLIFALSIALTPEIHAPSGERGGLCLCAFDASEIMEVQLPTPTYQVESSREGATYRYIAPVPVIVMVDEEFRSAYSNWKDFTYAWVERADDGLYNKPLYPGELIYFDIDLQVVQYVEWKSDGDPWVNPMLADAVADSWPIREESSYWRELVIAFTNTIMLNKDENDVIYEVLGKVDDSLSTIIIRPYAYPFDDNVLMHELSHCYFALDHFEGDPHYHDDCIMSYEDVWVDFWFEDGGIWHIGAPLPKFLLTENYCSLCHMTVYLNAVRFNPPSQHGKNYPISEDGV